jgi:hypothetical protein
VTSGMSAISRRRSSYLVRELVIPVEIDPSANS